MKSFALHCMNGVTNSLYVSQIGKGLCGRSASNNSTRRERNAMTQTCGQCSSRMSKLMYSYMNRSCLVRPSSFGAKSQRASFSMRVTGVGVLSTSRVAVATSNSGMTPPAVSRLATCWSSVTTARVELHSHRVEWKTSSCL